MQQTTIITSPVEPTRVLRICCSYCGARAKRIGLLPGGSLNGLSIKCYDCGKPFRADTAVTKRGGESDG